MDPRAALAGLQPGWYALLRRPRVLAALAALPPEALAAAAAAMRGSPCALAACLFVGPLAAALRAEAPLPRGALAGAFDGSCAGNGGAQARAGFGVVLAAREGVLKTCGPVAPFLYEWVDPEQPLEGFRPGETPAAPTNNRAEYLGACTLLLLLARGGAQAVEVVYDSRLVAKTLTEWLPARRRAGTESELKNLDLVLIAERLLAAVPGATFVHQKSHAARPAPGPARARWELNAAADALAAQGCAQL